MDYGDCLIFIKGVDRAEDIRDIKQRRDYIQCVFKNNEKLIFKPYEVKIYKPVQELDLVNNIIYRNGRQLSSLNKVTLFDHYIRICYKNGTKRTYKREGVDIVTSCLQNQYKLNCFDFLKRVSEYSSQNDKEEEAFLKSQYDRVDFVDPRSVLSRYLLPSPQEWPQGKVLPIFPFGFNLSQKTATQNAMSHQISVIEGPPGTGKTQTILNIIANAVMEGKKIAVVSNNNPATANVRDKLKQYDMDFISAYLGNRDNRDRFFAAQSCSYPNFADWRLEEHVYEDLYRQVVSAGQELEAMLAIKNSLALLRQELSMLQTEKAYFDSYCGEEHYRINAYKSFKQHNSQMIMGMLAVYQGFIEAGQRLKPAIKIINLLRYGVYSFSFYNNSSNDVITFLQERFYDYRISELRSGIQNREKQLEAYHFEQRMKDYSRDSMKLFKAKLAKIYSAHNRRKRYQSDVLWKQDEFHEFISDYPVIMSTTLSLRLSACKNYLFDYVVMDEASQIDISAGALALSCAKNAVIVGDRKQLPCVITNEIREKTRAIFQSSGLNEAYNYADNNMLSSVAKLFTDAPCTLLREHYRCHPKIIGFCNQKFYNNELIILTEERQGGAPLMLYKTVEGNHAREHYNQRQIDIILEEVLPKFYGVNLQREIGFITPFRKQKEHLAEALVYRGVEVDTVHKFQGREKNIIVLSTVVNNARRDDFADGPELLNVAVSRARDQLIIIAAGRLIDSDSNIGDLIRYIQYNNFKILNSEIYSVFDLLYKNYTDKLLSFARTIKVVSKYKSENIMNALIKKVLSEPQFIDLDWVMHVPLKMLIRDFNKLDAAEMKYADNMLTHVDFLIYKRVDKSPILAVEVDGYRFHDLKPEQLHRDAMKNSILNKYRINFVRFKTIGSNEEIILRNRLLKKRN